MNNRNMCSQDVRDVFRKNVLKAFDESARDQFNAPGHSPGATDGDLPRLFKTIDKQVEILANRNHVTCGV